VDALATRRKEKEVCGHPSPVKTNSVSPGNENLNCY
jgi:hypothetical protein